MIVNGMSDETHHINDKRLQLDLQTVELLQRGLKESNEQTEKMTNLLSNFETRLTALNDLIMPVYEATNNLQIKHTNIQKTVVQLDNIIEHYENVKNLTVVVQSGPSKDIATYISQLNKLKSAMKYFDENKNQAQKRQNEELWSAGKVSLFNEFERLLTKVSNYDISELNDEETLISLPTDSARCHEIQHMIQIIDWFKEVDTNFLEKIYEKLITFRKTRILEQISQLKKKNNSLRLHVDKRVSSPNVLSIPNADKKNSLRGLITDKRRKTRAQIDEITAQNLFNQDFEIDSCMVLIECFKKAALLFNAEQNFMMELCADDLIAFKILLKIYEPVLLTLKNDAELISNNAKLITKKYTSNYVIAIFRVLHELVSIKDKYIELFEQRINSKPRHYMNRTIEYFLDIFIIIENCCSKMLETVLEEIRNDPPSIQPNGNIHQITTETITFVEHFLEFDIVVGSIVRAHSKAQPIPAQIEKNSRIEATKSNEPKFKSTFYLKTSSETQSCREALTDYCCKVFNWLSFNLSQKSNQYEDPYLKCIFLLNNIYKISKLFDTNSMRRVSTQVNSFKLNSTQTFDSIKTINDLFLQSNEAKLKNDCDKIIINQLKEYNKCWNPLLEYIKESDDIIIQSNDVKVI
jgi:exocyst complex component 7